MITKTPVVGQYLALNYSWSIWRIISIDNSGYSLQLVSEKKSNRRKFIKKSKHIVTESHAELHSRYSDNVSDILQPELDTLLANYKMVMA